MSIELVLNNMAGYENVTMHHESEIRAMNRICDSITEGVIVSIGSFRGQMDCALALHAHVPVFCIDPRQGWVGEPRDFGDFDRPYWMQNITLMGLGHKVRPIELPSLTVAKSWDKPVGLLWIDGNHPEVEADLAAWMPHVVNGGLIATHDNNDWRVIQAVTRRDDMVEIERADLTTVYRKEPLHEEFTYDGIPMWVRKGPYSKDDRYVPGEVRSYDIGTEPIRTLIDVGCQIGAFSKWIKSLYPAAQIVGVEPETSCYLTAVKNLSVPGVTLLNQRVNYDSLQQMLFVDPVNAGSHRIVNREDVTPGQSVVPAPEAVTLEAIMRQQGWDSLSLLKIDAEGAEQDILMNCSADVLRKTGRIVGEWHSNFGSPIEPIAARLEALGFAVTWEQNPAAHATFLAINQNWQEPEGIERKINSVADAANELGAGVYKVYVSESDLPGIKKALSLSEEPAIEYGTVIEKPKRPAPKRTPPKGKRQ